MKKEKDLIKNRIVPRATKLHELLSGYTDEQVFSELQKRGYFGEITKRIAVHNEYDKPF